MITPVFQGAVNKGVLQVEARFNVYLASLEGQKVEVVVRKYRATRSNQQNRYYWGVVVQVLSEFTGFTPDEMHTALKEKFLGVERVSGLLKIRSTASLTTDEFVQYVNQIVLWAAEQLSVYIPSPGVIEY